MKILGKMIPLLIGDRTVARVVLNKLVYFADAVHYLKHGATISGEAYYKSARGPMPRTLINERERLVASGLLHEWMEDDGLIRQFSYSVQDSERILSCEEDLPETAIRVIDRVRERLGTKTASFLNDGTFPFEPWKSHIIGDAIDMARIRQDAEFPGWLRSQGILN